MASSSASASPDQAAHQDDEGKNAKFIRCTYCTCLILRPSFAAFVGDLKVSHLLNVYQISFIVFFNVW